MLLGLWKKIWKRPCYHPSSLTERKMFMPFSKSAACCCYRAWDWKTARAVTAFTHWENETWRNVCWSREGIILAWAWACLGFLRVLPRHHDFRTCLCEKKTQILPEVFDAFQWIIGAPGAALSSARFQSSILAGSPAVKPTLSPLWSSLTRSHGCQAMTSCKMSSREQKSLGRVFSAD